MILTENEVFKYETTNLPTFLKEFLSGNYEVTLIYKKKNSLSEYPCSKENQVINFEKNDSTSEHDLTGTPLEVDLGGDETFDAILTYQKHDNWTKEETKYIPVPIVEARKVINDILARKKFSEISENKMYALCTPEESSKTVLIGAQKCLNSFVTFNVDVIGCFNRNHEFTSIEFMEKQHKKILKPDAKIKYLINSKYYVHGFNLQNVSNSPEACSISIEAQWNKRDFKLPQGAQMTMILQNIIGHENSPVHFLWETLSLLQRYFNILNDAQISNSDTTVICDEPENELCIEGNLNELLSARPILKREEKHDLDLKSLRPLSLLDKLWEILKCCENLGVLKDCWNYFFETLAESATHNMMNENKSTIGVIIKAIIDGKIAIPTINFAKSLELLFELGTEKLLNDYLVILNSFYSSSKGTILNKWSALYPDNASVAEVRRQTSMCAKLASQCPPQYTKKMSYLYSLHKAVELFMSIKNLCVLSEPSMDYFCQKVHECYVANSTILTSYDNLMKSRLFEFSFSLNSSDSNLINCTPIVWRLKMTSSDNYSEVTTIYHVSEYKIFPENIFNYGGDVNLEEEDCVYISKFSQIVQNF